MTAPGLAFRAVLVSAVLERVAASAIAVLLGYQVFTTTHDALDLGWLGLTEALPGLALVLYGGHVADRFRRKRILVVTSTCFVALAGLAALASAWSPGAVAPLFGVAFGLGVVHAFEDPAAAGLEAQVVPAGDVVRGLALLTTASRLAGVVGPALGGVAWGMLGPAGTYTAAAALFAGSLAALLFVPDASQPPVAADTRDAGARIVEGVRFVWRDQVLLGSMALDLFAVFFGGATALLPAMATDVLHVGATEFGLLRGAMAAGALVAAALCVRIVPERRAGWFLLAVIGGFGVSIVVFGLSQIFWLSLLALFAAGVCDGLSVVVRRAILRLGSPEGMRGRVAAVKSVFVGSSNELGAFESGMAASLMGVTAAVWSGGVVTLAVVGATAVLAPRLRQLNLQAMAAEGSAQLHGDVMEQARRQA